MKIAPTFSLAFLVAANLVPIFGVLFFGWDVGTILLLYWLESVIIGALNLPKILLCAVRGAGRLQPKAVGLGAGLFTCGFFAVHYGMFNFVHLKFLESFFPDMPKLQDIGWRSPLFLSALGLFASHGFSFFVNFVGKKEYADRAPSTQMATPYPRVMVMHLTVILGGAAVQFFGAPIGALVILIAVKILIDVAAHRREHIAREAALIH